MSESFSQLSEERRLAHPAKSTDRVWDVSCWMFGCTVKASK